MNFRFVDAALEEFLTSCRFYEEQIDGLGVDFQKEVEKGITEILQNATMFRIVGQEVRRYLVKRFPFGIYYTIQNEVIVIWAVFHLHRKPDDLWKRLKNKDKDP